MRHPHEQLPHVRVHLVQNDILSARAPLAFDDWLGHQVLHIGNRLWHAGLATSNTRTLLLAKVRHSQSVLGLLYGLIVVANLDLLGKRSVDPEVGVRRRCFA